MRQKLKSPNGRNFYIRPVKHRLCKSTASLYVVFAGVGGGIVFQDSLGNRGRVTGLRSKDAFSQSRWLRQHGYDASRTR